MPEPWEDARRGEIWWAALDPTVGAEINKTRPCVVISNSVVNQHRRTVVVVPLSSSPRAAPPVLVSVTCSGQPAIAVIDQCVQWPKSGWCATSKTCRPRSSNLLKMPFERSSNWIEADDLPSITIRSATAPLRGSAAICLTVAPTRSATV